MTILLIFYIQHTIFFYKQKYFTHKHIIFFKDGHTYFRKRVVDFFNSRKAVLSHVFYKMYLKQLVTEYCRLSRLLFFVTTEQNVAERENNTLYALKSGLHGLFS